MSKRTVLREYLLSAVVAATPLVCLAGEPSALKPVEAASALRPVPVSEVRESTIQRAQFESSAAPTTISLVQHQRTSREAETEKKKPGFFKRLYSKISGNDKPSSTENAPAANANANSAASRPGVAIPTPPPIDFNMQTSQRPSTSANGVSAQPAGFGQGNAPTYHPANPNQAQPLVPGNQQYQQPANNGYTVPPRRMAPRNDGFIDPFESEGVAQGSDTFLDLDSLIEGRPAALAGAQNKIDVAEKTAESLIPEVDLSVTKKPMRIVAGKRPEPAQADSTGPFSGYRLPSDDQVLGLPEPEPESAPVQVVEESREPVAVINPVEAPQAVVRIPLLEEPSMALPPVSEAPVEAFAEAVEEEVISELAPVEKITKPIFIDPVPADTRFEQEVIVSTQTLELPSASSESLQVMDGRARREQQRFRIMSRTGKLGFKGFCPVTLRDERDLVDSRAQHKAKFGLQTYYFCSSEAKSAFEANPARYAPAGGGSDVVLLVNTGEETPGSLDFSLWYRDRLYMFRSRETQALFSKDPRRYADQY